MMTEREVIAEFDKGMSEIWARYVEAGKIAKAERDQALKELRAWYDKAMAELEKEQEEGDGANT